MWGSIGDKSGAHQKLVVWVKERRVPEKGWSKCGGWEDMAQVCRALYICLEDKNYFTKDALDYNGPDTKGGRGVLGDQVDGTNMEGDGEGDGLQIGNKRAT